MPGFIRAVLARLRAILRAFVEWLARWLNALLAWLSLTEPVLEVDEKRTRTLRFHLAGGLARKSKKRHDLHGRG